MPNPLSRRNFLNRSFGVAAGGLLLPSLRFPGRPRAAAGAATPLIVTSHSNDTGREAMEVGWEILAAGGRAIDAVEQATNVIEVDPEDTSVGFGGLPNEDGVVQLDASIMDGRTYNAGAVASLEGIKTPSSVARLVMDRTDHVMLVGPAALEFAKSFGFEEENLLTERAREEWLKWREERGENDDWGPPDHLRGLPETEASRPPPAAHHYGTVNVLAVDVNGDVAGITSTSGLSWKIPGRIGDSPIIGAGLYVDNDVGAAGATGRGEDVIKSCATYYIVMRMAAGRSPQEACEDALEMIRRKYRKVNPDFMPGEKFVAINKAGEIGAVWSYDRGAPRMGVRTSDGAEVFTGSNFTDGAGG
ncbi:MAG TPA: N(4)-(beta-N-acetylglucosaminyl)-L-asparaginase [Gemmatimonadota bacterium]|nr:N(4)-(beta-N-acetylglucosaminyl)-L-asparaginase [Gemmatimonadota bacterium]